MELEAIPQAHHSVQGYRVDFADLLARIDASLAFSPDSIEVMLPGGAEAASLPFQYDPAPSGPGRLLVRVPARGGDADPARLHPVRLRASFGPDPAAGGVRREDLRANLLPNGSMDAGPMPPVDVLYPGRLGGDNFERGVIAFDEERPYSGTRCLALAPDARSPRVSIHSVHVRVEPGVRYRFSLAARSTGVAEFEPTLYASVFFKDRAGRTLPPQVRIAALTGAVPSWHPFEASAVAPPHAASAFLYVKASGTGVRVWTDDWAITRFEEPEILDAHGPGGLVSAYSTDPRVRRFDFGPPDSPVLEKFTRVDPGTAYSPGRGHGFTEQRGPLAHDREFPAEALSRDFVASRFARFRVDLPDGPYRVWLRYGAYSPDRRYWIHKAVRLSLAGETLVDHDPSATETFEQEWLRHYDDLWSPDMDLYETFVSPVFGEKQVEIRVRGGFVELELENLPLDAMIVFPLSSSSSSSQADRELAALHARLERLTHLPRFEPEPPELAWPVPAEARARGFVVFARPRSERIETDTRPSEADRVEALSVVAARDEVESAVFSVYPLRDLSRVSVSVSPLSTPDGRVLPESAIDVRFVRYMATLDREGGYRIEPTVLDRRDAIDLPTGIPYRYWLRFHVEASHDAGRYGGLVRIRVDGATAFEMPITLTVLPLTLPRPRISIGTYYSGGTEWYTRFVGANVVGPRPGDDPELDALAFRAQRAHFDFMASVGYTGAAFKDDLRFSIEFEGTRPRIGDDHRFVRWMDAYTASALGPMPFYGFGPIGRKDFFIERFFRTGFAYRGAEWREAYRNLVLAFEERGRQREWPPILWYLSDELSNDGAAGVELGVFLAKLIEDLPGVRTIASINGPGEMAIVPHLDAAMPNPSFPITPRSVAAIRSRGAELWLYNVGDSRYSFGLYPWALRAGGRYQWEYGAGEPSARWYPTWSYAWGVQKRGPDYEIFPSEVAERHREGIDDYRYLQGLEAAIARVASRPGKREAVAAANAFLRTLRRTVPIDIRGLRREEKLARITGEPVASPLLSWSNLDAVRRAAARHWMTLERE